MLIKTCYGAEVPVNKEMDLADAYSGDQIRESEFEAKPGSGTADYW